VATRLDLELIHGGIRVSASDGVRTLEALDIRGVLGDASTQSIREEELQRQELGRLGRI